MTKSEIIYLLLFTRAGENCLMNAASGVMSSDEGCSRRTATYISLGCLLSFAFCSERSALRLTPIHSCFPYGMRSVGHGWMESLSEMQSGRVNRSERFHCDFCDRQMACLFLSMRLLVVDRQWVSGGLSFGRVAIRRVNDISKDSEMLNYSSSLLKFLKFVDQSLSTHNLELTTSADSSKIRFCSLIPRPNQYFDRQREIRHCGKLFSAGKELGN